MIEAKMGSGWIRISGHAGYAEPGRDIVCAGVSALAFGTLYAMKKSGLYMYVKETVEEGELSIKYREKSGKERESGILLSTFREGMGAIAEKYEKNVNFFVCGLEIRKPDVLFSNGRARHP